MAQGAIPMHPIETGFTTKL